ncbi:GerMN domain-containing protein [Virgibacillus kekensis]|uniref:GerMN domain-containing protein n=1 Tax=Virgibacillus kekensis TaxID=202261 RepID=A0ABV9DCX5_9BACI
MQRRSILLVAITVFLSIILTGCFQGEQSLEKEEIDPPKDAEAVNDLDKATEEAKKAGDKTETATETVSRQLYLLDANGMVAAQTLELPLADSKEVAEQALEYLVKDGPVTPLLPTGFQAVLPAGTEVNGLNLQKDGTLVVDVSKEFKEYEAAQEQKIIQAMTFTLTQFENVKNVKLRINGEPQSVMPVNGTPIGDGYSRADGINLVNSDSVDLMASKPVTLYYPTESNGNQYFVPVTKYIDVEDQDLYGSIINTLLDGPGMDVNAKHVFNSEAQLTHNPTLNSGVLEVVFNQSVLEDSDEAVISDEVMETLVRTLTEDESVEAVQVKVEDIETLFNENGEPYTKPVTKQTFTPTEKL